MSDWLILRTSSRTTLPLAASLSRDGFDVWTPTETTTRRVPRKNAKREVQLPIMPSYVFARVSHLIDLLQMAEIRMRRGPGLRNPAHADFSVLHAFGRIPLVADRHLDQLRRLEAKRTPIKRAAFAYPKNEAVRVKSGIYGGMAGHVIRSKPTGTWIRFTNGPRVEIPTSLLELDAIQESQVPMLRAA